VGQAWGFSDNIGLENGLASQTGDTLKLMVRNHGRCSCLPDIWKNKQIKINEEPLQDKIKVLKGLSSEWGLGKISYTEA
jgi:hypothetical protein